MWSRWFLLIVDSKRGGNGVPTICRFLIFGVLFLFFDFFLVLFFDFFYIRGRIRAGPSLVLDRDLGFSR